MRKRLWIRRRRWRNDDPLNTVAPRAQVAAQDLSARPVLPTEELDGDSLDDAEDIRVGFASIRSRLLELDRAAPGGVDDVPGWVDGDAQGRRR